jgi:NAD(P)-dependent dehydrogenase (short-subunit alcohol dehydrogenase family)
MNEILSGRRILITGGASGIGLAIAREFVAHGARVALVDRSAEGLKNARNALGDSVAVVPADVANPADVDAAVARSARELDGLDGVVNAAGISLWRSIEETSYDAWRNILSVNLDGPFLVCRAAIPELKKSGSGTIVNIGSGSSLRPTANFGAYCTSKAALVMLTKVLAMELVEFNIRSNAICPGVIHTPMVERTLAASVDREARPQQYFQRQAMKRFGTAEEIAKLALFLTGPDSSFSTGSAYSADGGSVFH